MIIPIFIPLGNDEAKHGDMNRGFLKVEEWEVEHREIRRDVLKGKLGTKLINVGTIKEIGKWDEDKCWLDMTEGKYRVISGSLADIERALMKMK